MLIHGRFEFLQRGVEVAEQTLRSVDDSLKAAQEAATLQSSERASRTAELERALSDVATLRRIAL